MNAHQIDTYPNLITEVEIIREAVNHDMSVLGICLGAQLLAKALSGGFALLTLRRTPRAAACLGRVESDQANVGPTVVQTDRVSVDHGFVHVVEGQYSACGRDTAGCAESDVASQVTQCQGARVTKDT